MRFFFCLLSLNLRKKDKHKGIRNSVVSWELFKMIYHMKRIKCSGFTFNKSQVEMSLSAFIFFSYNNLFSLLYPFSLVYSIKMVQEVILLITFILVIKNILKSLSLGFLFITQKINITPSIFNRKWLLQIVISSFSDKNSRT